MSKELLSKVPDNFFLCMLGGYMIRKMHNLFTEAESKEIEELHAYDDSKDEYRKAIMKFQIAKLAIKIWDFESTFSDDQIIDILNKVSLPTSVDNC